MNFQRQGIIDYTYVYVMVTTTKHMGVLFPVLRMWRGLDGERKVIIVVILPNSPLGGRWCCLDFVQLPRNLPAMRGAIFAPSTPSKHLRDLQMPSYPS